MSAAHHCRLATDEAIGNLGGDRSLYAQVAQVFLDDLAPQLDKLGNALAAGDFGTGRRIAHTIKGSAATLGVLPLRHLALTLEKACEAGNPDVVAPADAAFRAEIEVSSAALREFLQQG